MTLDHRARMTDDGFACCCGSESCIVTAVGVWTPSRRVDAVERREAVETFGAQSVELWVVRTLDERRGQGGALIAEHGGDESLYWRLTPSDLMDPGYEMGPG